MGTQSDLSVENAGSARRISLILSSVAILLLGYLGFILFYCPMYIFPTCVVLFEGKDLPLLGRIANAVTIWIRTPLGLIFHLGLLPFILVGAVVAVVVSGRRVGHDPFRMIERQVWLVVGLLLISAAATGVWMLGFGWPVLLKAIGFP
ncbi:MAG: hypothetical protein AB1758_11695 [Candidatus Eremiobacterota bacterium]